MQSGKMIGRQFASHEWMTTCFKIPHDLRPIVTASATQHTMWPAQREVELTTSKHSKSCLDNNSDIQCQSEKRSQLSPYAAKIQCLSLPGALGRPVYWSSRTIFEGLHRSNVICPEGEESPDQFAVLQNLLDCRSAMHLSHHLVAHNARCAICAVDIIAPQDPFICVNWVHFVISYSAKTAIAWSTDFVIGTSNLRPFGFLCLLCLLCLLLCQQELLGHRYSTTSAVMVGMRSEQLRTEYRTLEMRPRHDALEWDLASLEI